MPKSIAEIKKLSDDELELEVRTTEEEMSHYHQKDEEMEAYISNLRDESKSRELKQETYYFTFGSSHMEKGLESYVKILADSWEDAEAIMHASKFGNRYATSYPNLTFKEHFNVEKMHCVDIFSQEPKDYFLSRKNRDGFTERLAFTSDELADYASEIWPEPKEKFMEDEDIEVAIERFNYLEIENGGELMAIYMLKEHEGFTIVNMSDIEDSNRHTFSMVEAAAYIAKKEEEADKPKPLTAVEYLVKKPNEMTIGDISTLIHDKNAPMGIRTYLREHYPKMSEKDKLDWQDILDSLFVEDSIWIRNRIREELGTEYVQGVNEFGKHEEYSHVGAGNNISGYAIFGKQFEFQALDGFALGVMETQDFDLFQKEQKGIVLNNKNEANKNPIREVIGALRSDDLDSAVSIIAEHGFTEDDIYAFSEFEPLDEFEDREDLEVDMELVEIAVEKANKQGEENMGTKKLEKEDTCVLGAFFEHREEDQAFLGATVITEGEYGEEYHLSDLLDTDTLSEIDSFIEFSKSEGIKFESSHLHTIVSGHIPLIQSDTEKLIDKLWTMQKEHSSHEVLKGDSPTMFAFLKADIKSNLFLREGAIDPKNPAVITGLEKMGIDNIFDIDERDEFVFMLKEDEHCNRAIYTGDYNEKASPDVVSALLEYTEQLEKGEPKDPFIMQCGVDPKDFKNYRSTRNICESFLDMDNLKEEPLQLKTVDHYHGDILLIDTKDENQMYLLGEDGLKMVHDYETTVSPSGNEDIDIVSVELVQREYTVDKDPHFKPKEIEIPKSLFSEDFLLQEMANSKKSNAPSKNKAPTMKP